MSFYGSNLPTAAVAGTSFFFKNIKKLLSQFDPPHGRILFYSATPICAVNPAFQLLLDGCGPCAAQTPWCRSCASGPRGRWWQASRDGSMAVTPRLREPRGLCAGGRMSTLVRGGGCFERWVLGAVSYRVRADSAVEAEPSCYAARLRRRYSEY